MCDRESEGEKERKKERKKGKKKGRQRQRQRKGEERNRIEKQTFYICVHLTQEPQELNKFTDLSLGNLYM